MITLDIITKNGLFCDGDWIEKKDQDPNGKVRLIQLADIGECFFKNKSSCYITEKKAYELKCTFLEKGDILIARLPDPLGRACVFPFEGKYITAVDVSVIRIKNNMINRNYIMYMINSSVFRKQIRKYESGTTRKRISRKNLAKIVFNLPSVDKQNFIADCIKELFLKLDNIVENLKTINMQLKAYRQSVLKEAFEGRLTQEWRNIHLESSPVSDYEKIKISNPIFKDTSGDENEMKLILPESWIKIRIGNIFEVEVGATPSRRVAEYWNGNIPWVSSGEVQFNTISKTNELISEVGLKNSSTNVQPVGTVMLAMIGEGKTRGQAAIVNVPAAHNQNTAAILVSKTPCSIKYIYYFFQMNYENTRRVGSGNNQKALNKERVRAIRFPFASFEEQKVIVEEIEMRMSICDNIEKTIDSSLIQTKIMRQSILKKAFEGGNNEC